MNVVKTCILKHKFLFGCLSGLILFPVIIVLLIIVSVIINMTTWDKLDIPLGKESILVFHRKNAHSFLAEYDRKMGLIIKGKIFPLKDLVMNTGGRTKMNFYEYLLGDELWIRVKDNFGEYIFNLTKGESYSLTRAYKIPFRGPLNGKFASSSYRNNDLSTLEVDFGGKKAIKDMRFIDTGKYIGTLRGLRYYKASEMPKEQILTMFEKINQRRNLNKIHKK
jgi:hypothetical protein